MGVKVYGLNSLTASINLRNHPLYNEPPVRSLDYSPCGSFSKKGYRERSQAAGSSGDCIAYTHGSK